MINKTALQLVSCFLLFSSIFIIVLSVYGQARPVLNLGIRDRFISVSMRYVRHNDPDKDGKMISDPKVFFESVRLNRHGYNTTEGYLGYQGDEFDIAVHISRRPKRVLNAWQACRVYCLSLTHREKYIVSVMKSSRFELVEEHVFSHNITFWNLRENFGNLTFHSNSRK